MAKATHAYAGRCPGCGVIRAATVDDPEHKDDVARDVAEFIKSGLEVSHVAAAEVRAGFGRCRCPSALGGAS